MTKRPGKVLRFPVPPPPPPPPPKPVVDITVTPSDDGLVLSISAQYDEP